MEMALSTPWMLEGDTLKFVVTNRKARHGFHILDVFETGLLLFGTEFKTLMEERASLVNVSAQIKGGEAWLGNVHISEFFNLPGPAT